MSQPIHPSQPITKRHGANLPHWTAGDATYFVTFRLHDSLPAHIVRAWKKERERLIESATAATGAGPGARPFDVTARDIQRLHRLFTDRVERYLDAGTGTCWMNRPEIAETVQSALTHFHGERYDLHTWSIMPNHVHTVFRPLGRKTLSKILHSWKSFTAKQANKLLNRTGPFWQAESYDHLVRDQRDWRHCVDYTLENPLKAGLLNWRWTGHLPSAQHRRDADATMTEQAS